MVEKAAHIWTRFSIIAKYYFYQRYLATRTVESLTTNQLFVNLKKRSYYPSTNIHP